MKNLIFIIIMLVALGGCGEQKLTDIEYIAKAQQSHQSGDLSSAIIHLKNALKNNPSNANARLQLGGYYLELNDGVSAEKELLRAKKLGITNDNITLKILHALQIQNKYQDILKNYNIAFTDVTQENALQAAIVSEALLASGQLQPAEKLLHKAYSLAPDSAETQIARIKLQIVKSNVKQAETMLETFIPTFPENNEAKLIQGNIYLNQKKFKQAIKVYNDVIKNNQKNVMSLSLFSAYIGLIRSELSLKSWSNAKTAIDTLIAKAPKHPLPTYFDGVLDFELKNYVSAKEKLLTVLKALPDHLPSQLLLGTILYTEKSYEQASVYLTNFVDRIPTHTQARKLLAATKRKQNRPGEAVDILIPLAEKDQNNGKLLAMIGQFAIESGNLDLGGEYLRRAVKTKGVNTAAIRSELAKIYLAQGEESRAINELKKLAKTHPKQSQFMQALLYNKKGKFTKAKGIIQKLKKEFPKDPTVELLFAQLNLRQVKNSQAREHFIEALALKENFVPALLGIARLDINTGNLLQAKINFEKILNVDAINDLAMIGLAQIAEREGNTGQAIDRLEKARNKGRDSLLAHEILAKYYFSNKNPTEAIKISEDAAKKYPTNKRALQLLAFSQFRQKRINQVVETFQKIVSLYPKDANAFVKLASIQVINKNTSDAQQNLEKALLLDKKNIAAQIGLFNIELKSGNYSLAKKISENLVNQNKKLVIGHLLMGDVNIRQKNYKSAEKAYKKAYNIKQTSRIVIKYSSAISLGGDKQRALEPLKKWVDKHPDDARTKIILGTAYQSANDIDKSIELLENVLQQHPSNSIVLNNLSWMYNEKNDPRSIEYAEKAHKISPKSGSISDTLGWLLVQKSEFKRGTELLKLAVKQSNENPEVMYHLAVANQKQGLNNEAARILKRILDKDIGENIKKDVKLLLTKLEK